MLYTLNHRFTLLILCRGGLARYSLMVYPAWEWG
jgi:hypothetical protein